MCLERMTEGWVGVDGTDGGGETVPYVGAGHWEGTPSELRPASFDGSGPSSGGAKLAYIRVGRSKRNKVLNEQVHHTEHEMPDKFSAARPARHPNPPPLPKKAYNRPSLYIRGTISNHF